MSTIKSMIVKNMRKISLIMVVIILFLSSTIQIFSIHQMRKQDALLIFEQIEQILDENTKELGQLQKEYEAMCLNDARTVAYILEYNPEAKNNIEELKKIAADVEVDEIHIFDKSGMLVAGTHSEYFGLSFDSGEQMGFFKPLLTDYSLELVQEITPNTAIGKLVQYSALWDEDHQFIVQVGMHPDTVLRMTAKNELSYIFSLLGTGVEYSLYAVNPDTEKVVGSTVTSDTGKSLEETSLPIEKIASEHAFYTKTNGTLSYCLSKKIGENYIIWTTPLSDLYKSILSSALILLAGLVMTALILVYAVTNTMDRTVITQIKNVNEKLRLIQNRNFRTKVDIKGSKEFSELSAHINSMVASLLKTSEKLEMSEKIRSQKEELEKQREQLEAAVERAETASKAKSDFLFNMSHDIRTPMNAILGFTDLALKSNDLETQREYLKNIDISSKQLLDLINNILELSKIEKHEIMIKESLVDIKEMYSKLHTIFDSDLREKNLTYTADMDIRHTCMYIDKTLYSQIFLNIVSNAVKFTPAGGTITVSLRESDGDAPNTCFVDTVVEDNGIGMSAEFLSHVYESFSREQTSTDSGVPGAGLGLAIVKDLVDLMNGTIHIESQKGQGTKVTFRLPHRLEDGSSSLNAEEMAAVDYAPLCGRCILLAEDIDINALIATKLLSAKGCIVERAKDGVECVDMLSKADNDYYDLILMDIQMPNMDGYRATQVIRALDNEKKAAIPILALTANAFKEDRDKAAAVGMNGHIAKPIDTDKLFKMIAEVLKN